MNKIGEAAALAELEPAIRRMCGALRRRCPTLAALCPLEDTLQEARLRALLAYRTFTNGDWEGYVITGAYKGALYSLLSSRLWPRAKAAPAHGIPLEEVEPLPAGEPTALELLEERERVERVRQALASCHKQGGTAEEVAWRRAVEGSLLRGRDAGEEQRVVAAARHGLGKGELRRAELRLAATLRERLVEYAPGELRQSGAKYGVHSRALSEEVVRAIRLARAAPKPPSYRQLAEYYGVAVGTVHSVAKGYTYQQ